MKSLQTESKKPIKKITNHDCEDVTQLMRNWINIKIKIKKNEINYMNKVTEKLIRHRTSL